jgi:hypothetical protein
MFPDGAEESYDFLVAQDDSKPETRPVAYADNGVVKTQAITGSGGSEFQRQSTNPPWPSPAGVGAMADAEDAYGIFFEGE